ncbi:MAG: vWA domain-containing protein [Polyangiaceae bacterium]
MKRTEQATKHGGKAAFCMAVLALVGGCAKGASNTESAPSKESNGDRPVSVAVASASSPVMPSDGEHDKPKGEAIAPAPGAPPVAAPRMGTTGAGEAAHGRLGMAGGVAAPLDAKHARDEGLAFRDVGQAPGVKAGEWDDNANFRDFSKWLTSIQYAGARPMNLDHRTFVVVRDKDGKGIPGCSVEVRDVQGQRSAGLVTMASGRALFFPHAEGLEGTTFEATARCREGDAKATFTRKDVDGVVELKLQSARRAFAKRSIDLAFVLDTTGSMSEEIAAVKTTIQKVAKSLSDDQTEVRIGLVEYKDRTDAFVTKTYAFSSDLPGFAAKVSRISAGGGGDMPEDMNAGLRTALSELRWNDNAVAKLAFVIADAPPHLDYPNDIDYAKSTREAAHRGIKFYTVAASGMDQLGQVVFRQMAQYTGGTNLFVLRGGAGPQSTGGGDPGSSCGGTHQNYASGNLDELIVQKARRELKSLDQDPMRIAGLGEDESAKPCDRRIVFRD